MASEMKVVAQAELDREAFSRAVAEAVGGPGNIVRVWHCITRLRFDVRDKRAVDLEALKQAGAAGAQFSGDQLQVIVGSDVAKQYESLARHLEATESTPVETAASVRGWARFTPKRVMGLLVETLSGVFTPIVAAISGAGLLKGLNALAVQLGWLVPGTDAYLVWTLMADGVFYFLPFLVAVSAAKRFNVNVSLALAVPAALLYPTIVGGVAAVADGGPAGLEFLGLTVPFVNYASAVVPPILGVYLMGWVYRLLDRFVPPMLKIVVTPLLTLVITIPIVLVAIAPAGNYLGLWAADGLVWLYEHGGALAGIVLGGTAPLIVLIGMHYALFPVALQSLATRGYDVFLLPFQFIANLATAGATLAVAIRHKNDRALALSTALPAFFGITEPAIYGVTLRLKRPFYFTLAGGAVGGAYAAVVGLQCFGFAVPGLTSLPLYVSPDNPNNVVNALISIALSFSTALLLTLFFFKPEPTAEQASAVIPMSGAGGSVVETPVTSPVAGRVIALSEVPDSTFAQELLGPGVAILPAGNQIVAPFDGTVEVLPDTAHAVALRSRDGIELLIHVGIDTVTLGADAFTALANQGDAVTAGQPLLQFDRERITAAGLSLITPIVVTNAALLGGVTPVPGALGASVGVGQALLRITPA